MKQKVQVVYVDNLNKNEFIETPLNITIYKTHDQLPEFVEKALNITTVAAKERLIPHRKFDHKNINELSSRIEETEIKRENIQSTT